MRDFTLPSETDRATETDGTATITSTNHKGPFHFTDGTQSQLDPVQHPPKDYTISSGKSFKGQAVGVNGKEVVIEMKDGSPALQKAIHYLEQPIRSTITAVSLLHASADAAVLRDITKAWGNNPFVKNPVDLKQLGQLFSQRRGERLLFFGHVETSTDGTGRFITQDQDSKATFEVSLSWLQAKSKEEGVEVMFLGCTTFAGGASAGVLHIVHSGDVANILTNILDASTRLELYASFSAEGNPAFISPEKLVAELSAQHHEIRRTLDKAPIAIYSVPPMPAPPPPPPPPSFEDIPWSPKELFRELSWGNVFLGIVSLALAFMTFQVGLLDPLNQIVKYQNYRYGRLARICRVLNRIAINAEKMEPGDPSRSPGSIGGIGLLLIVATPLSFFVNFGVGIVLSAVLAIFSMGQWCRELNKEYER